MNRKVLVVVFLIALMLHGCSPNKDEESTADFDPRAEVARPELLEQVATRPAIHGGVLSEFARRGGGECVVTRAESVDGVFHFEWESPKDLSWTAAEVVGAIMSVLRGYDGYVGGLEIVRTYVGGNRRVSISHADYSEFVEGRINDPAFVEKHQLEQ